MYFSQHPLAKKFTPFVAPFAHIPMAALDASGLPGSAVEIWQADNRFTFGQHAALQYRHNDEILFGVIQLDEEDFDNNIARDSGKTPLQLAAEHAYQEIFKLTNALEFPHILRFWNFFADINGQSHGMERYRQFNMGRHDGFLQLGRKITGSAPAASALGFSEGPLTICFFAARGVTPIAIENPRQVSAYQYPEDYGPRSPTFSRASMVDLGGKKILFISGTASIVGHQTVHVGDVVAQTRETVVNLLEIVTEANRMEQQAEFAIENLFYRVYVRHPQDVPAINDELRRSLGQSARLTFLAADICRQDLLMEIEATAGHPAA